MSVEFSEAELALRERARRFGEERIAPNAMEYVESGEWPWELYERAGDAGLAGVALAEAYGGRDASLVETCIVAEEFCRADSSVGIALVGADIGTTVVSEFGTEAQKERWLPPVAAGEATTAIGLTEPDTGSALAEVSTTARKEGTEYVVEGEKTWIANGRSADWTVTLCRTDPDAEDHTGLSMLVVPTDAEGYRAEPRDKLGLDAAEHTHVTYDGVRVPEDHLLGDEGEGFYQTLAWLEHGRIGIAAAHLGIAEGAFDRALAYSREREQGGQPVGDYQGMRWKLADMRTKCRVARSQVYHAARLVDAHERGEPVEENLVEQASIAKLYATEICVEVAEQAVQVFGGEGYARENEVEHFYRDAKVGTIYEGTSEIQRNTIGKVLFDEL